ncbi:MAG: hypothetical protein ACRCVT_14015 [Leadbetterella sp.]
MKSLQVFAIILFFLLNNDVLGQGTPIPEIETIKVDTAEPSKPILFEQPKAPWRSKLLYGGNIFGGFWGQLYLDASPTIAYELNEKGLVGGIALRINYLGRQQIQGQSYGSSSLAVGPQLYLRQKVFNSFFAHAEYELINAGEDRFFDYIPNSTLATNRRWGGATYVGLGFYRGMQKQQSGAYISVLYNLSGGTRGFIDPQGFFGNIPIVIRFGALFKR